MFKRLKNAFLGRNRMSERAQREIRRMIEMEYRNDVDFATYMYETGQIAKLQQLQETCR